MLCVPCDSEKLFCDGKPTAIARLLETVEIPAVPCKVALIRTGVGTVPAFTRTSTLPRESVCLVTGTLPPSISSPPASVVGSSRTV